MLYKKYFRQIVDTRYTFNRDPDIPINTLRDFLNYYPFPISETEAFKIARVHRTTWRRWMNGESEIPAATMELIRLHATGQPATGWSKAWDGFRFFNGKLVTPCGRFTYTPEDIMMIPVLYGFKHRLESIERDFDLQRKLFTGI